MKRLTVEEFNRKNAAGEFASKDVKVQIEAGWYDWFCSDISLASKTAMIGSILARLTSPEMLKREVSFCNCCPALGPLFNRVYLEDHSHAGIDDRLVIEIDDKRNDSKYLVVDLETNDEEGFDHVWDLAKYLNEWKREV